MHTIEMRIDWDPGKAETNKRKHGVSVSDVEEVFMDPHAISTEDPDANIEPRFIVTGADSLKRLVTIVYTYRPQNIRIISARKATNKESREYERRIRF